MEFKKYASLENHYRQKEIGYWLDKYPELKDEWFQITEKIHGANFQILITKDEVRFGKRTSFLKESDSFYDWQNVVKKYETEFNYLQNELIKLNLKSIRLYGELFGGKIQKGVDYGMEKQIKVFDIYIDEELKTPKELWRIFSNKLSNLLVPQIQIVKGLFNVLEFETKFNTTLLDKEDNICEGIVIKPYNKTYINNNGTPFYIKKKNEEFKEKSKSNKTPKPIRDDLLKLQVEFSTYINENRLDSVFSKYGEIQSEKQIGEYIRYFMEDAKEDFIKDFSTKIIELDKNDLKLIYGKGNKDCVKFIKNRL